MCYGNCTWNEIKLVFYIENEPILNSRDILLLDGIEKKLTALKLDMKNVNIPWIERTKQFFSDF